MARIPSFEEILLEVHQSLGLKTYINQKTGEKEAYPSRWKDDFSDLGMSLGKYSEEANRMLHAIFLALDMDATACRDASLNVWEWRNFHKALELRTWTGKASQRQVLWHLLAYCYAPALGRRLAFWSLDGVERGLPMDAGMPGGKFWFMPHWDKENNKIDLPVPQVIDWLLDLLDEQSVARTGGSLGNKHLRHEGNASLVRTLHNWRKGSVPKSTDKIEQLFPDDAALRFDGAFILDETLSLDEQLQKALEFVRHKGLDAVTLWDQIPMTVERLEPVLNGTAEDDEKQVFLTHLSLRYAPPTMGRVRQRLRVARMTQDAYRRLLDFLCPKVEKDCTDPAKNKLLQLIGLFQTIYNLTIAAYRNCDSSEEQDSWFESRLAPWDKADLLLSIVPSAQMFAYRDVAQRLTRKFVQLGNDGQLPNLIPTDELDAMHVLRPRVLSLQHEIKEDLRVIELIEKLISAGPEKLLQEESSFWVLSQLAGTDDLPVDTRKLAVQRMREIAVTSEQGVWAIVAELGLLLNGEARQRPKDAEAQVQALLDEAEACEGNDEWKAPLLRFRAKHRLAQSDFSGACEDYRSALKACSERSYGGARGEIARDGFAAEIAEHGVVPNNQEKYYRNMLAYDMFEEGVPSFEKAASWCEEFFWTDLYQPYSGIKLLPKRAVKDFITNTNRPFT